MSPKISRELVECTALNDNLYVHVKSLKYQT